MLSSGAAHKQSAGMSASREGSSARRMSILKSDDIQNVSYTRCHPPLHFFPPHANTRFSLHKVNLTLAFWRPFCPPYAKTRFSLSCVTLICHPHMSHSHFLSHTHISRFVSISSQSPHPSHRAVGAHSLAHTHISHTSPTHISHTHLPIRPQRKPSSGSRRCQASSATSSGTPPPTGRSRVPRRPRPRHHDPNRLRAQALNLHPPQILRNLRRPHQRLRQYRVRRRSPLVQYRLPRLPRPQRSPRRFHHRRLRRRHPSLHRCLRSRPRRASRASPAMRPLLLPGARTV